jgi:NAD(P)-dependent dehydrogenase (short-subunit alcohol dehydrogenase family)
MRQAMSINCEAPFFLTAALYPFMVAKEDGIPGRVLHVSSGAAHRPIMGWSVYCITKAAFYQSYKALQLEFQQAHGGRVVVGSFKPGVVDTPMQGVIRDASAAAMPTVSTFQKLKESMQQERAASNRARPPPSDALDTPENVAHFAEFLLLGTSDDEFGMEDHDIRDKNLYTRWIAPEDL